MPRPRSECRKPEQFLILSWSSPPRPAIFFAAMQFRVASAAKPGATIRVTVRLFAQYAELVGAEAVAVDLPPGATVADAVAAVRREARNGQKLPERPLAAVNLTHVLPHQRLADGDELALLPPLAGG